MAKLVLPSTALIDFAKDAGLSKCKLKIIPNGVRPCNNKAPNEDIVRDIKQKWNINTEKDFCFLSLSSSREIKNLDCLVEGFAKAKQKENNLKLLLACEKRLNYPKFKTKSPRN